MFKLLLRVIIVTFVCPLSMHVKSRVIFPKIPDVIDREHLLPQDCRYNNVINNPLYESKSEHIRLKLSLKTLRNWMNKIQKWRQICFKEVNILFGSPSALNKKFTSMQISPLTMKSLTIYASVWDGMCFRKSFGRTGPFHMLYHHFMSPRIG